MAKSLLFSGAVPYQDPPGCLPGRQEVEVAIRKDGRMYRLKARDKIAIEDPLLVAVRAEAYAIQEGEEYAAQPTPRNVRDHLVKTNIVI